MHETWNEHMHNATIPTILIHQTPLRCSIYIQKLQCYCKDQGKDSSKDLWSISASKVFLGFPVEPVSLERPRKAFTNVRICNADETCYKSPPRVKYLPRSTPLYSNPKQTFLPLFTMYNKPTATLVSRSK